MAFKHISIAQTLELLDKEDVVIAIIIVCYHGMSSQGAASYLVEQGFEDVYSMDGGFTAWEAAYSEKVER